MLQRGAEQATKIVLLNRKAFDQALVLASALIILISLETGNRNKILRTRIVEIPIELAIRIMAHVRRQIGLYQSRYFRQHKIRS